VTPATKKLISACKFCTSGERETNKHFLTVCPGFAPWRTHTTDTISSALIDCHQHTAPAASIHTWIEGIMHGADKLESQLLICGMLADATWTRAADDDLFPAESIYMLRKALATAANACRRKLIAIRRHHAEGVIDPDELPPHERDQLQRTSSAIRDTHRRMTASASNQPLSNLSAPHREQVWCSMCSPSGDVRGRGYNRRTHDRHARALT
jgi:hypothetical protein